MTAFSDIYRANRWNGVESRSGPGSGPAATKHVAEALVELVRELDIAVTLDVACGDSWWMPDLPMYLGMDIAPEAVRLARKTHPDRQYMVGDVREQCGFADLVIFRDALQHMSQGDGLAALDAIRRSGSTWLLASTYVGTVNVDIETGGYCEPNLQAAPYSMSEPERLIPDGYSYHDPDVVRDPRKMLGLWRIGS